LGKAFGRVPVQRKVLIIQTGNHAESIEQAGRDMVIHTPVIRPFCFEDIAINSSFGNRALIPVYREVLL
jgi:hypothetical protein